MYEHAVTMLPINAAQRDLPSRVDEDRGNDRQQGRIIIPSMQLGHDVDAGGIVGFTGPAILIF
jgi:hypothetical protein